MAEKRIGRQPTSGGSVELPHGQLQAEPEVLGTKALEGVVAGGATELRSAEGSDPRATTFPALSHNRIHAHERSP